MNIGRKKKSALTKMTVFLLAILMVATMAVPFAALGDEVETGDPTANEESVVGQEGDSSSESINPSEGSEPPGEENLGIGTLSSPPSPAEPGTVLVNSWSDLRTAITNANSGSATADPNSGGQPITKIVLANGITRSGDTGSSNDLPNISTANLTIDGNGHTLDFGPAINRSMHGITLASASSAKSLTVKNLKVYRSASTARDTTFRNMHFIGVSYNEDGAIYGEASNTKTGNWTVNVDSITYLGGGNKGASPDNSAFVQLIESQVNFYGTNHWNSNTYKQHWTSDNNICAIVQGKGVHFRAGSNTYLSAVANIVRLRGERNNSGAVRFTAEGGAKVDLFTRGNSYAPNQNELWDTAEDSGLAIYCNGWDTDEPDSNPPEFLTTGAGTEVTCRSLKGASGTWWGMGTIYVAGNKGFFTVQDGAKFNVTNNNLNSALVWQSVGSTLTVDNAEFNVWSRGSIEGYFTAAALWFRWVGGQTFNITNNARVTVTNTNEGKGSSAAIRAYGSGNAMNVTNGGQLIVRNLGTTSRSEQGESADGRGSQGIETQDGGGFKFNVSGYKSSVEIYADKGLAIDNKNHSGSRINVSNGAIFIARGWSKNKDTGIFYGGSDYQFTFDNPLYYDFANTRSGGGRVFRTDNNDNVRFKSTNSDVGVWKIGTNPISGDPYRSWAKVSYELRSEGFRQFYSGDSDITASNFGTGSSIGNSTGMPTYTRINGNNAPAQIKEILPATNADKYVRAIATVPEGLSEGRPAWTDEVYAVFKVTPADGSTPYLTAPAKSIRTETVYGETKDGVIRFDAGGFLHAGDKYEIASAWRGNADPNNAKARISHPEDLTAGSVTVIDKMPPKPAEITTPHLYANNRNLAGTWKLDPSVQYDNPPVSVKAAIGNVVITDSGSVVTGTVNADGTWTYVIPSTQRLNEGDKVTILLEDEFGNINPINAMQYHDANILPGSKITVEAIAYEIAGKAKIIGLDEAKEIKNVDDLKKLIEAKGYDLTTTPKSDTAITLDVGTYKYGDAAAAGTYSIKVSVNADPGFYSIFDVVVKPGKVETIDGYSIIYKDITSRYNFAAADAVTGAELLTAAHPDGRTAVYGEYNAEQLVGGNHWSFVTTPKAVEFVSKSGPAGTVFNNDTNYTNDTFKVQIVEHPTAFVNVKVNVNNGVKPVISDPSGNPLVDKALDVGVLTFNPLTGVKVTDDFDDDAVLTAALKASGVVIKKLDEATGNLVDASSVNTAQKGIYKITYSVTDSDTLTATETITVVVGYTIGDKYIIDAGNFYILSKDVLDTSDASKTAQIISASGARVWNADTLALLNAHDTLEVSSGLGDYKKLAANADDTAALLKLEGKDDAKSFANITAYIINADNYEEDGEYIIITNNISKKVSDVAKLLALSEAPLKARLIEWADARAYKLDNFGTEVAVAVEDYTKVVAAPGTIEEAVTFNVVAKQTLKESSSLTQDGGNAPVIDFKTPYEVAVGDSFDLKAIDDTIATGAVKITDTEDDLEGGATQAALHASLETDLWLIENGTPVHKTAFSTEKPGVWRVIYTVEDSDKKTTTKTRVIVVNDGTFKIGTKFIVQANGFGLSRADAKKLTTPVNNEKLIELTGARAFSSIDGTSATPIIVPGSNTNGFYDDSNFDSIKADDVATYPITVGVYDDVSDVANKALRPVNGFVFDRDIVIVTEKYVIAANDIRIHTDAAVGITDAKLKSEAKAAAFKRVESTVTPAGVNVSGFKNAFHDYTAEASRTAPATGDYDLTFKVAEANATAKDAATVNAKITKGLPPILTVSSPIRIELGTPLTDAVLRSESISAEDQLDESGQKDTEADLLATLTWIGAESVDVDTAGSYVVTYQVTDSDSQVGTDTRVFIVDDGTFSWDDKYIVRAKNFVTLAKDADGSNEEILAESKASIKDAKTGALLSNDLLEVTEKAGYPGPSSVATVGTYSPIKVTVKDTAYAAPTPASKPLRNIEGEVVDGDIIVVTDQYVLTAKSPVEKLISEMPAFIADDNILLSATWANVQGRLISGGGAITDAPVSLGTRNVVEAQGSYTATYLITAEPSVNLTGAVNVANGNRPHITASTPVEVPVGTTWDGYLSEVEYDDTHSGTVETPKVNIVVDYTITDENGAPTALKTIDTSVDGLYTIHYTATDAQGDTNTATRVVIVYDDSYTITDKYTIRARSFVAKSTDVTAASNRIEYIKDKSGARAWDNKTGLSADVDIINDGGFSSEIKDYNIKLAVRLDNLVFRDIKAKVVGDVIVIDPPTTHEGYYIVGNPVLLNSFDDKELIKDTDKAGAMAKLLLPAYANVRVYKNDNSLTENTANATAYTGNFDGTQNDYILSVQNTKAPQTSGTIPVRVDDGSLPWIEVTPVVKLPEGLASWDQWQGVSARDLDDERDGIEVGKEYNPGTLNLAKRGVYYVEYQAKDSDHHTSDWVRRTVIVGDIPYGDTYAIDAVDFGVASDDVKAARDAGDSAVDRQIISGAKVRVWLLATGNEITDLTSLSTLAVTEKTQYTPIADSAAYKQVPVGIGFTDDPLVVQNRKATITAGTPEGDDKYRVSALDIEGLDIITAMSFTNEQAITLSRASAFRIEDTGAWTPVPVAASHTVKPAQGIYKGNYWAAEDTRVVDDPADPRVVVQRDIEVATGNAPSVSTSVIDLSIGSSAAASFRANPWIGVSVEDIEDDADTTDSKETVKESVIDGFTDIKWDVAGVYVITYHVTDSDKLTGQVDRVVVVNDGSYSVGSAYIVHALSFALTKTAADALVNPQQEITKLTEAEAWSSVTGGHAAPRVITNTNAFYYSSDFTGKDIDGDGIVDYPFTIGASGDETTPPGGQAIRDVTGTVADKKIVQTPKYIIYYDDVIMGTAEEKGISDEQLIAKAKATAVNRINGSKVALKVENYEGPRDGSSSAHFDLVLKVDVATALATDIATADVFVTDGLPPVIEASSPIRVARNAATVPYEDGLTMYDTDTNPDYITPEADLRASLTYDSSAVDTSKDGVYQVTYTITDKHGQTATVKRAFVVGYVIGDKYIVNADSFVRLQKDLALVTDITADILLQSNAQIWDLNGDPADPSVLRATTVGYTKTAGAGEYPTSVYAQGDPASTNNIIAKVVDGDIIVNQDTYWLTAKNVTKSLPEIRDEFVPNNNILLTSTWADVKGFEATKTESGDNDFISAATALGSHTVVASIGNFTANYYIAAHPSVSANGPVRVVDGNSPVINATSPIKVDMDGAAFDHISGLSYHDTHGGVIETTQAALTVSLKTTVTYDGNAVPTVNTNKDGVYIVTYQITDSDGNVETASRTVIVDDGSYRYDDKTGYTVRAKSFVVKYDDVDKATDINALIGNLAKIKAWNKDGAEVAWSLDLRNNAEGNSFSANVGEYPIDVTVTGFDTPKRSIKGKVTGDVIVIPPVDDPEVGGYGYFIVGNPISYNPTQYNALTSIQQLVPAGAVKAYKNDDTLAPTPVETTSFTGIIPGSLPNTGVTQTYYANFATTTATPTAELKNLQVNVKSGSRPVIHVLEDPIKLHRDPLTGKVEGFNPVDTAYVNVTDVEDAAKGLTITPTADTADLLKESANLTKRGVYLITYNAVDSDYQPANPVTAVVTIDVDDVGDTYILYKEDFGVTVDEIPATTDLKAAQAISLSKAVIYDRVGPNKGKIAADQSPITINPSDLDSKYNGDGLSSSKLYKQESLGITVATDTISTTVKATIVLAGGHGGDDEYEVFATDINWVDQATAATLRGTSGTGAANLIKRAGAVAFDKKNGWAEVPVQVISNTVPTADPVPVSVYKAVFGAAAQSGLSPRANYGIDVTVSQGNPPVIHFEEVDDSANTSNALVIPEATPWNIADGVSVWDAEDDPTGTLGKITAAAISIPAAFDPANPKIGAYKITYEAIDSNGNRSTEDRKIVVGDAAVDEHYAIWAYNFGITKADALSGSAASDVARYTGAHAINLDTMAEVPATQIQLITNGVDSTGDSFYTEKSGVTEDRYTGFRLGVKGDPAVGADRAVRTVDGIVFDKDIVVITKNYIIAADNISLTRSVDNGITNETLIDKAGAKAMFKSDLSPVPGGTSGSGLVVDSYTANAANSGNTPRTGSDGHYDLTFSVAATATPTPLTADKLTVDSHVTGGNAPILTTENPTSLNLGDTFDVLSGVAYTDVEDGTWLKDTQATLAHLASLVSAGKLAVTGTVDTNTIGVYNLHYELTDTDGRKTTADRIVGVGVNFGNRYAVQALSFVALKDSMTGTNDEALSLAEAHAWKIKDDVTGNYIPAVPADSALRTDADTTGYQSKAEGTYPIKVWAEDSAGKDALSVRDIKGVVKDGDYKEASARYIIISSDVEKTKTQLTGWTEAQLLSWANVTVYDRQSPNFDIVADGASLGTNNITTTTPATVGAYLAEYVVKAEPATTSKNNRVDVIDGQRPVIHVSPTVVELDLGDPAYTDALALDGISVTDPDNASDLTSSVAVTNPVDTSIENVYTVEYNVTDSDGNAALPVYRTVIVNDGSIITTDDKGDPATGEDITHAISAKNFVISKADVVGDTGLLIRTKAKSKAWRIGKDGAVAVTANVWNVGGFTNVAATYDITFANSADSDTKIEVEGLVVDEPIVIDPPAVGGYGYYIVGNPISVSVSEYNKVADADEFIGLGDVRAISNKDLTESDVTQSNFTGVLGTAADGENYTIDFATVKTPQTIAVNWPIEVRNGGIPVITATSPIEIDIRDGKAPVWDKLAGVSVKDPEDDPDGTLRKIIPVCDESNLPSGLNIAGSYTVTYTAADSKGNAAAPVERTVVINDGTIGIGDTYIIQVGAGFTIPVTSVAATLDARYAQILNGAQPIVIKTLDNKPAPSETAEVLRDGGYTNVGGVYKPTIAVVSDPKAAAVTTATVTARTFRVTFNLNTSDASAWVWPTQLSVTEPNLTVTGVPGAVRTGYAFTGWTTSPSGGSTFSAGAVLTGNITVYAQWRLIDVPQPPPAVINNPPTVIRNVLDNIVQAITPEPTPLAEPEAEAEVITPPAVPRASAAGTWSLFNLLLAILGLELLFMTIIVSIMRGRDEDDEDTAEKLRKNRKWLFIIAGTAVANFVIYIFTQTIFKGDMVVFDGFSILMAAVFIISLVAGTQVFGKRNRAKSKFNI